MRWRLYAGLTLAGLVLLSVVQNLQTVEVQFLWIRAELPLAWLLAGVALLSGGAGLLLGWFAHRRRQSTRHD